MLLRHPDVTEVAVYAVPDPAVGDQVMAALVMMPGAEFDVDKFRAFLAEQTDLGPKQWPSYAGRHDPAATPRRSGAQAAVVGRADRRSGVADPPLIP